jgi:hypothetical protein
MQVFHLLNACVSLFRCGVFAFRESVSPYCMDYCDFGLLVVVCVIVHEQSLLLHLCCVRRIFGLVIPP